METTEVPGIHHASHGTRRDISFIDASLGVCAFPIVEKNRLRDSWLFSDDPCDTAVLLWGRGVGATVNEERTWAGRASRQSASQPRQFKTQPYGAFFLRRMFLMPLESPPTSADSEYFIGPAWCLLAAPNRQRLDNLHGYVHHGGGGRVSNAAAHKELTHLVVCDTLSYARPRV